MILIFYSSSKFSIMSLQRASQPFQTAANSWEILILCERGDLKISQFVQTLSFSVPKFLKKSYVQRRHGPGACHGCHSSHDGGECFCAANLFQRAQGQLGCVDTRAQQDVSYTPGTLLACSCLCGHPLLATGARTRQRLALIWFCAVVRVGCLCGVQKETKYAVFGKNLELIKRHNLEFYQGKHTYELALNEYADITWEEFSVRLGA